MTLPPKFRKQRGKTIATFSFIEFASGTGYVAFYPAIANNNFLIENTAIISEKPFTDAITEAGTLNFPITFNKAVNIEGRAIINIPTSCFNAASATTINIQVQPIILKNTTTLVTGINNNFTTGTLATSAHEDKMMAFDLTIANTHFAIGDELILRLIITSTTSGSRVASIGHDPANTSPVGDTAYTEFGRRSQVLIPFRITD